ECARKLIEIFERSLVRVRTDFLEANVTKLTRKSCVLLSLRTHGVDVFEAGAAIETNVLQVLLEETVALAKEEDRDQGKDNNCNSCVAAKERLDRLVRREPFTASEALFAKERTWGRDSFHTNEDAERLSSQQPNKCYVLVTSVLKVTR